MGPAIGEDRSQRVVIAGDSRNQDARGCDDPTVGAWLEIEAMHGRRWHVDQRIARECVLCAFDMEDAAAFQHEQQMVQIAMRMRPDRPIVTPAAFGDRLDVQETLVDVLRRFSVQEILRDRAA
jgi:hypothetical protein